MVITKLRIATAFVMAVGLLVVGWGVYQTRAAGAEDKTGVVQAPGKDAPMPAQKGEKPADDAKDKEKINLPRGMAPVQVLASLDKDGKLVLKSVDMHFTFLTLDGKGMAMIGAGIAGPKMIGAKVAGPGPGPGPGPGAGAAAGGRTVEEKVQSLTVKPDEVQILDTRGKKIDKKELEKLLKKEVVAMAAMTDGAIDPLHLRVLKEGTLVFVLPMPKRMGPGPGKVIGGPGLLPAPGTTEVPPGFGPECPELP
jgi:hypothetical protein